MILSAIDKHGNPVDFLLTAKRNLNATKRFFQKMLRGAPLLSPAKSAPMVPALFLRPSGTRLTAACLLRIRCTM